MRGSAKTVATPLIIITRLETTPSSWPISMRLGIVEAARETELTFNTAAADRPAAWWVEGEEGFAIAPEADLVTALVAATQPEDQGPRYAFSCYRASEYAMGDSNR